VFAAHGLFSGDAKDILCEADNLEKVRTNLRLHIDNSR